MGDSIKSWMEIGVWNFPHSHSYRVGRTTYRWCLDSLVSVEIDLRERGGMFRGQAIVGDFYSHTFEIPSGVKQMELYDIVEKAISEAVCRKYKLMARVGYDDANRGIVPLSAISWDKSE